MRKRRPLCNLPNALTLSRFLFAPVMLVIIQRLDDPVNDVGAWKLSLAAIIVLVVTLLTDLFDGMVARARHEVTNFGKIMDPVADSTFFMTIFFSLSDCPRFGAHVSVWFPVLILYREIGMHILRRYAALKGHAMPAKKSGKIKTFTQGVAVSAFFLLVLIRDWMVAGGNAEPPISESFLQQFVFYVCCYTVGVTYWSLIEYSKDVPELIAEYTNPSDGENYPQPGDGNQ